MDDSKIFSKTHEAYKESFEILEDFGIFGTGNPTKMEKLWKVFISIVILYPPLAFLLGYGSVESFGKFVEYTALFVALFDVAVRVTNARIWQNKIIEIAELFQELKKFDESEIIRKSEITLKRVMKFWLFGEIFLATFYCISQSLFNDKNVLLDWVEFENIHVHIVIGIVDWTVIVLFGVFWISCQTILFMAYTQLTAHLKCLIVKFSKIEKPKNAEDSKENLEKLHEIVEIHQKLKR
jgi:hypothetical protein